MQTTREKFEEMLYNRGLFESQASAIMDKVVEKDKSEDYHMTFDCPASEYPDALYAVYFMTHVSPAAVEWIDENLPRHFARAMFASKS